MRYSVALSLRTTGLVVLLGVIMTILDTTIMNVAVNALTRDFQTTLATMQWVITGYLLAMSMTIPITGWAVGRFGAKGVWLASLVLFTGGSVLSAAAWSVGSLVAFRAVQGLGGGLLMPVGQAMIAQAAGQERMGRGMAMISVPAMLAPVLGPVLGGVIVESLDWRWLFLVNVPVCAVALLAAILLLPNAAPTNTEPTHSRRTDAEQRGDEHAGGVRTNGQHTAGLHADGQDTAAAHAGGQDTEAAHAEGQHAGAELVEDQRTSGRQRRGGRLDVVGLVLLSPGLAGLVFGLSEVGNGASLAHPAVWIGLALVAAFVIRALRTPGTLLDLRLFGDRTFAAAVGTLVCYSAALFGVTVLVPLYSQLSSGGSALDAGLLMAPMGVGAALTMPIAGRLTDRSGPRGVGAAGIAVAVAGMLAFVAFPGYVPMFVLGLGHGLVAPSVAAAAFKTLDRAAIPAGSTLNNIAVRLASSFGVALLAVLLQVFTRSGVAQPFTYTFWCAIALAAVSLAPLTLIRRT
ncbi:MFS transporter [Nonomuraea sp. NPDC005983]|uniref:MFS transporter n=1 Tax=Nonomuraea sp. NPDC005983 TaxID=3155595 RepID=UPI0033ADCAF3